MISTFSSERYETIITIWDVIGTSQADDIK